MPRQVAVPPLESYTNRATGARGRAPARHEIRSLDNVSPLHLVYRRLRLRDQMLEGQRKCSSAQPLQIPGLHHPMTGDLIKLDRVRVGHWAIYLHNRAERAYMD